jgi:transposase-like protein
MDVVNGVEEVLMPTSTRRKVRDEADAQDLLAQLADNGDELRAFCAEHGVDGRSLRAWRRRLHPQPDPSEPPQTFQLMELVPDVLRQPERPTYRIHCQDLYIEFDDHFDDHSLRRILDVLAR